MDRSVRIPTDIIDRLLMGLDSAYRNNLSVGYPLPTDVDTNWAFPVSVQIENEENFPVLGLHYQFTYYGATVYDITLTSLANVTSLAFYIITPKDLALQPMPHRLTSQRVRRIGKTRRSISKDFHSSGFSEQIIRVITTRP